LFNKKVILEKHGLIFGYFLIKRESFLSLKYEYISKQKQLFEKIIFKIDNKIFKLKQKINSQNKSTVSHNSKKKLIKSQNETHYFKSKIYHLQLQKNDLQQKNKRMNDINFIDATKDHLYLDLIYSEEHYLQEYKSFEQKHKMKSLELKNLKKYSPIKKRGLKQLKK
jgi:hypothetical protein